MGTLTVNPGLVSGEREIERESESGRERESGIGSGSERERGSGNGSGSKDGRGGENENEREWERARRSERQRQSAGEYELETKRFGMWVFLAMEILFFGGALFLYSGERHFYPQAFALASHHLEWGLASINTAILLTSSFTMAMAVHRLERAHRGVSWALVITAILGFAFLLLKGFEYILDLKHGTLPIASYHPDFAAPREARLFYSLYFYLTLIHACHLTIGVAWCSVMAWLCARKRDLELRAQQGRVEVLGLYWHFVDVVWIFLLPLFYLIGGPA